MKKHGFKKIISMILAVGLLASAAGCGNSASGGGNSASPGDSQGAGEKTKIVLLLNGYLGDLAWYDCSAAGINAIKEKYPNEVETKIIEMTTDKSKYDSIIKDTLSEDWDVIVAGSWTMVEYIENAAKDYPEKEFWFFDEPIEGIENVYSMSYNANEGSFLAGMAAASVSKTGVIGFIGGEDSTIVNDSLVGYLEGAAYVNPDIKAMVSYTGNWDDSAKGKELALVQYNAGADVVFQLASNAGIGVFEAAKETGKLAIGSDTDQSAIFQESDPAKSEAILTSSLKRVDTSLLHAYELYKENEIPYGTCEKLGLDKDCVGIVENDIFSAHVTADQAAKIAQAKQDIIGGKLKVSSAYGMSTEEISAFKDKFIK
ncbi:Basic membrane protein [uncultured Eubacteriales bacterium]|uniref:Basic membrane protein n=1 Tax=uncultured Eubacteriales bacterium TaxID=172733 RepID=A0A212KGR5_9FIRM|nr:Basic membrane protein [uncultured Eubacteriales bacterium]